MSQQSIEILKRLLQENRLQFILGSPDFEDEVAREFIKQLEQVTDEYRRCVQDHDPVDFSPEALANEAAKNPHKVRAFLQAFASPCTPPMLVMTWRILQGMKIRKIEMEYAEAEKFSLKVVLAPSGDGPDILEEYESNDIWDAILLRHLGICKVSGGMATGRIKADKPVFFGFNPLRLGDGGRAR